MMNESGENKLDNNVESVDSVEVENNFENADEVENEVENDFEKNGDGVVEVEKNDDENPPPTHEKSFFTDERGNLRAVNIIVRNPCAIFWTLIILCFVLTFGLNALVISKAPDGNPFTSPENEYELNDIRSIQYDSFRLAQKEVSADLGKVSQANKTVNQQSQQTDITYWVFEGANPNLFGSAESIEVMKDAYDIFLQDPEFHDFCRLAWPKDTNSTNSTNTTTMVNSTVQVNSTNPGLNASSVNCTVPLTPLSMYFPSYWDSIMVAYTIESLKDEERVESFNQATGCVLYQLNCDQLPSNITTEDIAWANSLKENVTNITKYWDMTGVLVENFTQVTELAAYLKEVDAFKGYVDFGFDLGFSKDNQQSKYSRGIISWGGPLEARNGTADEEEAEKVDEEEDDLRKDYIIDNHLEEMDKQADESTNSDVNSYYFMIVLIGDVIIGIVVQDGLLAIFSLAFVFFWLRINTGSWFLAGVGIFEIFLAIPVSWFIFSVVFQIKYFATLNALAIFIVAAIGADDIFIFMDAYKQSKFRNPENLVDLETRMSWVYRRTGTAMAITSATTCAAFLCTLITPLASIQSFGVFAAVVIFIDYVLVMTLFCTAVVIYHDRYEDRACCGCCCTWPCGKTDPSPTEQAKESLENGEHKEGEGDDKVSSFFRNKVAGFIGVPLHRIVLAVVFLSWMGVAIWQATLVKPTREAEQFLADDNPLQKSLTIINREFPTADDDVGLKVYFTWGLGEINRDGVNLLLDPENFGTPTYDSAFDFNEQCQTELVSLCNEFRTDSKYRGLIKRKNGLGQIYCFIEELAAYKVKGDLNDCEYVQQGEWKSENWTITEDELPTLMEGFLEEESCFESTRGGNSETTGARYRNELGWDGENLIYASVAVEDEVLNPFSQEAEATARRQYDQYVDLVNDLKSTVTKACTKSGEVIMTDTDGKFTFMNNQSIYVQSALQSSLLGVAIAFVVLFISTRVFHLALFASLSICSVLVSVVGVMVLLGWTLGSIESILIGITAGFSVDYVVHLAHAYEIGDGSTVERIRDAFGDMGISVLNGMVTSVAASIPLFFCQLQFFAKFGTFLCLTIAFSWIFANFAFMSALAQFKIPIKEGGCRL
jgi:predicted RND superfamily exporter protein